MSDLAKAIEVNPDNYLARIQRGRVYGDLHQYEKAGAAFSEALGNKAWQGNKNWHPRYELAVLRLIANGFDHHEIAHKLCISPDTSKARLKTLRAKLGASTCAMAVYKAFNRHLLD